MKVGVSRSCIFSSQLEAQLDALLKQTHPDTFTASEFAGYTFVSSENDGVLVKYSASVTWMWALAEAPWSKETMGPVCRYARSNVRDSDWRWCIERGPND